MSTMHRWLANNPVWVAFAFLATCLALGRLLVGNADLSPANVAIAFVGAYGGWLLAQAVSASNWCSPEGIAARRSESREIAMAALFQANAAIAAQQPRLRNDFPRTATQSN
jgi:hypothetical protein